MSFRIVSDLHTEFYVNILQFTERLHKMQTDNPTKYLIMAGDITTYKYLRSDFTIFLDEISKDYEKIFYVLGNHEFYNDEEKTYEEIVEDYTIVLKNYKNVVLLNNSYVKEGSIKIFGGTGFYNSRNRTISELNSRELLLSEVEKQNEIFYKSMKKFLVDTSKDPGEILIITHHMMSEKLRHPIYKYLNPFGFSSDFDDLFSFSGTWVYGHQHTRFITKINEVNCYCNPYGYPGENLEYIDMII
jgi:predicted MPP superfamily phosphohydrolase